MRPRSAGIRHSSLGSLGWRRNRKRIDRTGRAGLKGEGTIAADLIGSRPPGQARLKTTVRDELLGLDAGSERTRKRRREQQEGDDTRNFHNDFLLRFALLGHRLPADFVDHIIRVRDDIQVSIRSLLNVRGDTEAFSD